MRKIFLDVGSHIGQTIKEVIKNKYNFDKIYGFEPCKNNFNFLVEKYGSNNNLVLNNFGLSDKSKEVILYDPESIGASIYSDKRGIDITKKETIKLLEASEWIKENLKKDDIIFMKLNCEGSECDILENMIDNNIFDNINHIMIDFDVVKIKSQTYKKDNIMKKIKNKKNYDLCEKIMIGKTHGDRINNWLKKYL